MATSSVSSSYWGGLVLPFLLLLLTCFAGAFLPPPPPPVAPVQQPHHQQPLLSPSSQQLLLNLGGCSSRRAVGGGVMRGGEGWPLASASSSPEATTTTASSRRVEGEDGIGEGVLLSGAAAAAREFDRVELRVYDISSGYAGMLGQVLRKDIEGIWHVGVAVFGKEYWFSTHIEQKALEDTEFAFGMAPKVVYDMGRTSVCMEDFEKYLEEELSDLFRIEKYNVFENNCNHFAQHAIKFLTGGSGKLPSYVIELSDTALDNMPKGQALLTRTITNQAARVVMLAWGNATRSKEQKAKREARKMRQQQEEGGAAAATTTRGRPAGGDHPTGDDGSGTAAEGQQQ